MSQTWLPPAMFGFALLLIFALMFWRVFRDPVAHRPLMVYGMLLKLSYCGVVFGHWLAAGISAMFDDSKRPVDREVFLRALSYYEIRSAKKE